VNNRAAGGAGRPPRVIGGRKSTIIGQAQAQGILRVG
jgi:hypothetical protein